MLQFSGKFLAEVRFKRTPEGGEGLQPVAVLGESIPGRGSAGKVPGLSKWKTAGLSEGCAALVALWAVVGPGVYS